MAIKATSCCLKAKDSALCGKAKNTTSFIRKAVKINEMFGRVGALKQYNHF